MGETTNNNTFDDFGLSAGIDKVTGLASKAAQGAKKLNREKYNEQVKFITKSIQRIEYIYKECVRNKKKLNESLRISCETQYERHMDATTSDSHINNIIIEQGFMGARDEILRLYSNTKRAIDTQLVDKDKAPYLERLSNLNAYIQEIQALHRETGMIVQENIEKVNAEKARIQRMEELDLEYNLRLQEIQDEVNGVSFNGNMSDAEEPLRELDNIETKIQEICDTAEEDELVEAVVGASLLELIDQFNTIKSSIKEEIEQKRVELAQREADEKLYNEIKNRLDGIIKLVEGLAYSRETVDMSIETEIPSFRDWVSAIEADNKSEIKTQDIADNVAELIKNSYNTIDNKINQFKELRSKDIEVEHKEALSKQLNKLSTQTSLIEEAADIEALQDILKEVEDIKKTINELQISMGDKYEALQSCEEATEDIQIKILNYTDEKLLESIKELEVSLKILDIKTATTEDLDEYKEKIQDIQVPEDSPAIEQYQNLEDLLQEKYEELEQYQLEQQEKIFEQQLIQDDLDNIKQAFETLDSLSNKIESLTSLEEASSIEKKLSELQQISLKDEALTDKYKTVKFKLSVRRKKIQ